MSATPTDFPQDLWPADMADAKTKFPARLTDGRFVLGLADEERLVYYELSSDIAMQLVPYCMRKKAERPAEARYVALGPVETSVRNKGWDVSAIEISWVMACLDKQL